MKRCGLVLLLLLAAPSAASAAQGPLLSLTPERVTGSASNRVALAGQPWRVRVVMQPWVEGQTATVRFYRHGHKLRAVLAFRKVAGLARTTAADSGLFKAVLAGKGTFRVRHPEHGKHVEADLSRQVVALIRGSRVERIYPASSGKPSTPTIQGSFRVYSKLPGFNAKAMYYSNFFIRGFAIHGYASVPVFAASHGCLRIPNPDAVSVFRWIKIGDIVDVYP